MSLIKQNVITGCVSADGKWPDVSKAPSSYNSIVSVSATARPSDGVHVSCGCSSWMRLESSRLEGGWQGTGLWAESAGEQVCHTAITAIYRQTHNVRACKGHREDFFETDSGSSLP